MFDRAYVLALENLIMDDLLPMYLIGCRSAGVDPKMSSILKKLMESKALRREYPALLDKSFSVKLDS